MCDEEEAKERCYRDDGEFTRLAETLEIQLLGNAVALKIINPEDRYKGRVIPAVSENDPDDLRADVLAVGPGAINQATGKRSQMMVRIGDVVLFKPAGGALPLRERNAAGEVVAQAIIVPETSIMAILKSNAIILLDS